MWEAVFIYFCQQLMPRRQKPKALFVCHPYSKTISEEPSSLPSEVTDCLIQKPFKARLQQCEKMDLTNFTEICSFYGHEDKTTDSHLVTTADLSYKTGAKWGCILASPCASGSSFGKGNGGGHGKTGFLKTMHLSRTWGFATEDLWRLS